MKKINIVGIDEEIYYDETEMGMPIIMWVNDKVKNFYMTLNVKYGSIHTEFKTKGSKNFLKVPNGIAHFLEHMMFYMPDGQSAHEYFNDLGSSINACTTNDFTFYEVFGSNKFKDNLNYLLDYVQTPYFTKENVKSEREIITEEIKMYQDEPNASLIFKTNELLWHKNKRKYLISGTVEDIKKINVDNLSLVYDNFYHPANMFIIITGNFNPNEAVAIIKENEKQKKFNNYEKPQIKSEKEPNKVVSKYYEENRNVSIPKLKVTVKVPLTNFKEYRKDELKLYLAFLLKNNFGLTSEIHENLFNNNLITKPFSFTANIWENHFTLTVSAETNYPDEVIKEINKHLDNMNVTSEELNRQKKILISAFVLTYDDIEEVNTLLQDNIIADNMLTTDTFKVINTLNMETFKKIMKKLSMIHKTVVIFKPTEKKS